MIFKYFRCCICGSIKPYNITLLFRDMNKYLLLLRENWKEVQQLSPEQMQHMVEDHIQWANQLAEENLLLAGDGLSTEGKVIKGKDALITDGPYVELKEIIGGYYLIQAPSMEKATAIALQCPCHQWGGTTEVRPIMDYE